MTQTTDDELTIAAQQVLSDVIAADVKAAALEVAKELLRKLGETVIAERLAEREACAVLAEKIGPDAEDPDGCWYDIAEAIRARNT